VTTPLDVTSWSSPYGHAARDERDKFVSRNAFDDFLVPPMPLARPPQLKAERRQVSLNWAGGITLEEIVRMVRDERWSPGGPALVSIIFTTPDRVVLPALRQMGAYLHLRSGHQWHIFVAGYGEDTRGREAPRVRFDAASFDELRRQMPARWRYSGLCDVVSVMAYQDHPQIIDWESFRSVTITRRDGTYVDRSFGQIAELMSDWPHDPDGLADYAPGEAPAIGVFGVKSLEPGLRFIGYSVSTGVLGNFAYDMLKVLF
jgi:hypothetical protein